MPVDPDQMLKRGLISEKAHATATGKLKKLTAPPMATAKESAADDETIDEGKGDSEIDKDKLVGKKAAGARSDVPSGIRKKQTPSGKDFRGEKVTETEV